jgi:pimeloyl-ACP methyl ester carboxylesterase
MPFVDRDTVSVFYELEGDGSPLFLLGGAGVDGSAWRKAGYTAQLASDYRCIAVDPRGYGRSSRPAEPEAMRLEEMAADVLAVADELGFERFTLWGHSAGAYVVYTLAAAEPSRVTAIVGAGGSVDLDEAEASGWREWGEATAAAARAANDVLEVIQQIMVLEGIDLPPWGREWFQSSDPEMFARQLETLTERFRPEWLQLAPPRLMLLGEHEVPPDWVQKAKRVLANTEIVLLPGLGHLGSFLARDQAINAAHPFLTGVGRS